MKYGLVVFKETTNLGDDIQSYSIKKLLPQVDYYIEREKLNEFTSNDNEIVKAIIGGWYNHDKCSFPPSPFINPLFISIHLTDELSNQEPCYFTNYFLNYLKKYEPIGLRDDVVKKYLEEKNIKNYFSGCTTLTLEKFKDVKKTDNICLVDLDYFTTANIKAKYKNVITRTHHVDKEYTNMSYEERFAYVENILKTYQSSKMVITTRLHCARPCLALGVPVLLVYDGTDIDISNRLSKYTKMVNYVSKEEFQKNYDNLIKNIKDNPNEFTKYKKTILNTIKDFLNKPTNNDKNLNNKLYSEYFVKQKENFEKIFNEKVKLITLESNERYELLKEKEKELKKENLINEALMKENELYKNNFQKLVDDFEKTNAQLYQITNSRSYKLALKFNSLFSFLRKIKNKLKRSK